MNKRVNYPFFNLKEATERVADLRTKLGGGPYKVGAVLQALGYTSDSGASRRGLASLSHYGLLQKTPSGYELTKLAMRIVRQESEGDRLHAIREAARKPRLFADLLAVYEGDQLPTMLENYLIHNFEMSDLAAKKASNVFKKTLRFADMIDESGKLRTDLQVPDSEGEIVDREVLNAPGLVAQNVYRGEPTPGKTLPSGITISFPESLDLAVLLGEFAGPIKMLEEKAQSILRRTSGGDGDEKPAAE